MKKKSILCLAALLVAGASVLTGCGKADYDYESNDLSAYVTLPSDWKEHDYKAGLKLKDLPTDEDIQNEIDKLLKEYGEEIDPGEDALVEDGDDLIIDFKGTYKSDGKDDNGNEWKAGDAFEGGTAEDTQHTVNLEESEFIPGFDEGLIGMKKGSTKDLELTFPENYGTVELAGVDVIFTVTVDSIARTVIPELTDELVSENSEDFEGLSTAAEYREHVKNTLTEEVEAENDEKLINAAWKYIYDNATVIGNGPEGVLDDYTDTFMDYYKHTVAANQNMHLKEYVKSQGYDSIEAFKTAVALPDAQKALKERLVVWSVAKAMGVTVTEEQIKAKAQEEYDYMSALYQMYGMASQMPSFNSYYKDVDTDTIKQGLLFDAALEALCGIAD